MKTAALYIRVSTEDQTEFSPDAQKRLLMEYAKKNQYQVRNDYIYIDEGISGRNAEKRPAFMRMIAAAKCKPKPFDVILIHRFDRFSRSREDSIVYKSLLKKECNIKVISITEQLEDDKFSVILEAMLEAMAEYYSLNLADEVTKGMTEKALRGGFQACPPLGYKVLHQKELPVIVPEEAHIVQMIFDRYVNKQMSPFEIARYLNSLGFLTKRGNPFERRSVEYILSNPFYRGYIRWNRTHHATNTPKKESEWILKKGQHEALISDEIFELANARLSSIQKQTKKSRPLTEYHHFLSGLIRCSNCGRSLTVSMRKDSRTVYFQCNGYNKGKCNRSHFLSANKIIPILLSSCNQTLVSSNIMYERIVAETKSDQITYHHQLSKLMEKEKRLKNAYLNGIDTIDEYKKQKEYLQHEKDSLLEQYERYSLLTQSQSNNQIQDLTKKEKTNITNFCSLLTDNSSHSKEINNALKSIIKEIRYIKNEEMIDIYFFYR